MAAELTGALFWKVFIFSFIDNEVNFGANLPNYIDCPIYVIAGIWIIAYTLLMLLIVVYTKGTKKEGRLGIGAIVGLDIFLFG